MEKYLPFQLVSGITCSVFGDTILYGLWFHSSTLSVVVSFYFPQFTRHRLFFLSPHMLKTCEFLLAEHTFQVAVSFYLVKDYWFFLQSFCTLNNRLQIHVSKLCIFFLSSFLSIIQCSQPCLVIRKIISFILIFVVIGIYLVSWSCLSLLLLFFLLICLFL